MTAPHSYNRRYIIPDWESSGATQIFVYSDELGAWYDVINQCWRVQAWMDEHIAPHYKLAPSPVQMMIKLWRMENEI